MLEIHKVATCTLIITDHHECWTKYLKPGCFEGLFQSSIFVNALIFTLDYSSDN